MKNIKATITALCLCAAPTIFAQQNNLPLIPQPAKVVQGDGTFTFSPTLKVWADAYDGDSIKLVLQQFEQKFTPATGTHFKYGGKSAPCNCAATNTLATRLTH